MDFSRSQAPWSLGTFATIAYLCPAYVRGEAYLMLGDGPAAAKEFHKFIDHYGTVSFFTWGALARLGLARAYALEARLILPPATKLAPLIRISSLSGRTPTPTSPSTNKRRPSTRIRSSLDDRRWPSDGHAEVKNARLSHCGVVRSADNRRDHFPSHRSPPRFKAATLPIMF